MNPADAHRITEPAPAPRPSAITTREALSLLIDILLDEEDDPALASVRLRDLQNRLDTEPSPEPRP